MTIDLTNDQPHEGNGGPGESDNAQCAINDWPDEAEAGAPAEFDSDNADCEASPLIEDVLIDIMFEQLEYVIVNAREEWARFTRVQDVLLEAFR